jgi:hypothetical protein
MRQSVAKDIDCDYELEVPKKTITKPPVCPRCQAEEWNPVYQPEVAADAVHSAAHHRRREVYVGVPTVYTI